MNQPLPKRNFVSSIPAADTRELRKLGLFHPPHSVQLSLVGADGEPLDLRIDWDPLASRVKLALARTGHAVDVDVVVDDRVIGGAYYFVCPVSGERCIKLYYSDEGWAGRKAKRLVYASQYGFRSARYKTRLRKLSSRLAQARGDTPEGRTRRATLESRLRQIRREVVAGEAPGSDLPDLAERQRAILREVSLGAEMACERARALTLEIDDSLEWLFRRCDAFRQAAQEAARSPARSRAPTELRTAPVEVVWNFPRISLRTLQGLGHVKAGARRGARLDWTGLGVALDRCNVVIDLRDEAVPYAGFEVFDDRGVTYQVVRLERTPQGFKFICPFAGSKTDTLAYRAGWLASAGALKLDRF